MEPANLRILSLSVQLTTPSKRHISSEVTRSTSSVLPTAMNRSPTSTLCPEEEENEEDREEEEEKVGEDEDRGERERKRVIKVSKTR